MQEKMLNGGEIKNPISIRKQLNKGVQRNISLDLLRIIAMLMIITLHYLGKGCALTISGKMSLVVWFLEIACMVAVNVYVLISGYFLVDGKFTWKKVFVICRQTWFYSFTFLILALMFNNDVSIKEVILGVCPIILKVYWFVTIYLFMYIMSPYLNILINNMDKRKHFSLCLILVIIFSIIQLFLPSMSLLNPQGGYSIVWFLVLYLIAGYIKRYATFKANYKMILIYFVITTFLVISKLGLEFLFNNITYVSSYVSRIYEYYSIFILINSLCLFLYFKDIKITNQKLIKLITFFAPLTFGVYLIHENIFVVSKLYSGLFNSLSWAQKGLIFIIAYIVTLVLIFIVCSLIEYLRMKLFSYLNKTKMIKKIELVIQNMNIKLNKLYNFIISKS